MKRTKTIVLEPSEPNVNLAKRLILLIYCELQKLGPLGPLGSRCTIKRSGALNLSIQSNSTILILINTIYIITMYRRFFYSSSVFRCEPSEPFEPFTYNSFIVSKIIKFIRFTLGSLGPPILCNGCVKCYVGLSSFKSELIRNPLKNEYY